MLKDTINNEYFEWLFNMACEDRFSKHVSYRKLLMTLHGTIFRYSIPMDENRANDGTYLRYRFTNAVGYDPSYVELIEGPCSVLEMMLALAMRCEENIMDDPLYGNRTSQWFWGMINSLGLNSMIDSHYDKIFVKDKIDRFLNRQYKPNGEGGLFTIKHCKEDLRKTEIWYQLCCYINELLGF